MRPFQPIVITLGQIMLDIAPYQAKYQAKPCQARPFMPMCTSPVQSSTLGYTSPDEAESGQTKLDHVQFKSGEIKQDQARSSLDRWMWSIVHEAIQLKEIRLSHQLSKVNCEAAATSPIHLSNHTFIAHPYIEVAYNRTVLSRARPGYISGQIRLNQS